MSTFGTRSRLEAPGTRPQRATHPATRPPAAMSAPDGDGHEGGPGDHLALGRGIGRTPADARPFCRISLFALSYSGGMRNFCPG
jgi:hypothetical protein